MNEPAAPEFSRIVRLDQIGRHAGMTITADEAERQALARRFRLLALDRLEADYGFVEQAGAPVARGQLRASLAQPCIATDDPVPETIDTPFIVRFVRESDLPEDEETELAEEDCDTAFFSGDSIDIGEAVAQTLALALDPYPRSKDADAYLARMGVKREEQSGPFAALLALKGRGKDKTG
jgi:uncharacterized metal-binding protein YceD (DUF177 family)